MKKFHRNLLADQKLCLVKMAKKVTHLKKKRRNRYFYTRKQRFEIYKPEQMLSALKKCNIYKCGKIFRELRRNSTTFIDSVNVRAKGSRQYPMYPFFDEKMVICRMLFNKVKK